jgi:tetratricopeptide (TPR) repeat protein
VGNIADAQAALWQALLRDPENPALRVQMAECFVDLADYESAEAWYQGAVAVAPEDVEFHLMLVRFYLEHLYRVEEGGVLAAKVAAELAPSDARTQGLLGWAHYLIGDWVLGEQALTRALELDPGLASTHFYLGSLYTATGRYELARHHLQRAADLDKTGYYRQRTATLLMELR